MNQEDNKEIVLSRVHHILEGDSKAEANLKPFLETYLRPKIIALFSGTGIEYEWRATANEVYVALTLWLDKNSGFIQLNDTDLFHKVNSKVYNLLRSKIADYFSETYLEGYANPIIDFYTDEDGNEIEVLTQRHYDALLPYVDRDIQDLPAVKAFKEELIADPMPLINRIQNECTMPAIRQWLVKTFPSIEAFDFLIEGDTSFLRYAFRRNTEGKLLKRIKRNLDYIDIFDHMHLKEGQELVEEMAKLKIKFLHRGERLDNQELNRRYETQCKDREKKYGHIKPTNEVTLRVKDKDINLAFDQFVKLYLPMQKRQEIKK